MNVRDLIPWRRSHNVASQILSDADASPFLTLHREMNRLFDDVFRAFDSPRSLFTRLPSWTGAWPSVEISDGEKEICVTAEIPGLSESDIEVLLQDGILTLRGEKRAEAQDKDRQFSERFYGHFERRIPLDCEVEEEKVKATFKDGVLTVTLPKTERAQSHVRRITING